MNTSGPNPFAIGKQHEFFYVHTSSGLQKKNSLEKFPNNSAGFIHVVNLSSDQAIATEVSRVLRPGGELQVSRVTDHKWQTDDPSALHYLASESSLQLQKPNSWEVTPQGWENHPLYITFPAQALIHLRRTPYLYVTPDLAFRLSN